MLSVVVFKWRTRRAYRSTFGPEHVHTMRNMVARHYPDSHRFICITDDPAGLDVETVPLWNDFADVPNPSYEDGPSCYRRLKMFSRDIGSLVGERFVCIDLDAVIVGDLRPLWNRPEPFIGYQNPVRLWPMNGSMFLMTAGARPQVWETFNPETSPQCAHAAQMRGSDQGWMSYVLGWREAMWTHEDGVISFPIEVRAHGGALPRGTRIVFFWGRLDPWSPRAQMYRWVREHYR